MWNFPPQYAQVSKKAEIILRKPLPGILCHSVELSFLTVNASSSKTSVPHHEQRLVISGSWIDKKVKAHRTDHRYSLLAHRAPIRVSCGKAGSDLLLLFNQAGINVPNRWPPAHCDSSGEYHSIPEPHMSQNSNIELEICCDFGGMLRG